MCIRDSAICDRNLIVVFGCGGDRDRSKRPLMGRAASNGADLAIVTSDNPRSEDPAAIIAEIKRGMRGGADVVEEIDRRAAIKHAVREAGPGDVVVIAGKGHEQGQTFATETLPFDDVTVVREALEAEEVPEGCVGARFIGETRDLAVMSGWLLKAGWKVIASEMRYLAKNPVTLDPAHRQQVGDFLNALDDHDDVHHVYAGLK